MLGRLKILLVSSGFYPEISPRSHRATELAKEFCRQGHDVTVITRYREYDYSSFLIEFPFQLLMWRKPCLPKVPESTRPPFSIISRIFKRTLLLLFEYPGIEELFLVKKMLKDKDEVDLMISFAVPYPVHWGVAFSRTRKHLIAQKWVADCGDPYMLARLDSFKKPFYFKFLEKKFCRKCDYITVPFKEMSNQFYSEFLKKIKVVPQGFNLNEPILCKDIERTMIPVFIFAGSIIPGKRDLSLFMDFLSSVNKDFHFIIYTNQKGWFQKYRKQLEGKLTLLDYIERPLLIYEMSKADFLVNVDTILDQQSHIEAVPSKLIDYSLASRPILNINSSQLDEEMVMDFLNGDYSRQRIVDISKHDIKNIAKEFISMA